MFDVLIVGGGAAGLCLAAMLKKENSGVSVAVAEKMDRVGKKLAITGNGRCNITNLDINKENYYSNCLDKAYKIIENFSYEMTEDFFASLGLGFATENKKVYPLSFQANSVVDLLRFRASQDGTKLLTDTKVRAVKKENNVFIVSTENKGLIKAKTVIIATGGLAGGSKLGSDGDGYKILQGFGHKIIKQNPVIVQVKTDNTFTRQLKGIKVNAKVSVKSISGTVSDYGEVLFCDYGLSGPPILQLSRHCVKDSVISLDLLPDFDEEKISKILSYRREILKDIPLSDFFAGLINKKLGQTLLKALNISQNKLTSELSEKEILILSKTIKCFSFKVLGNTDFTNAQATSGGADLKEFDENLMSKKISGLFAVGEVLDLDGDCGGYNLQWAWSSAFATKCGILKFLGDNFD